MVDPGDNIPEIEEKLRHHGLKVKAIVITHAHIDHVAGASELKRKTNAPVYMNTNDEQLLAALDAQAQWLGMQTPDRVEIDSNMRDGDQLTLGNSEFRVIETPGHTQGSVSLYMPQQNKVLAGDTLFRDSIGRTDLPGGNTKQILSSIKARLLVLPDETIVVPGHGATTTIGRERDRNPFLQKL